MVTSEAVSVRRPEVSSVRRAVVVALAVLASTAAAVPADTVHAGAIGAAEATGGTLVSWGEDGEYGEISPPPGLQDVVQIDGEGYGFAVLRADGTAAAWFEGYDEWGIEDWADGLTGVQQVAMGGAHVLALLEDGTVTGHGWDAHGQTSPPPGVADVVGIAAGGMFSMALTTDGTVEAWGADTHGVDQEPTGLAEVIAIGAGSRHALAATAQGTVVAWGDDREGQATPPDGLTDVVAVDGGNYHSVALRSDGTVVAWGDDDAGQSTVPTGLSSVTDIAAGAPYSVAVVASGGTGDTVPPVVTVPGFITKVATSSAGARVWATGSAYDAVAGEVPTVCTYPRGSWFPLGRTVVTCTASDPSGNTASASFTVKIIERR